MPLLDQPEGNYRFLPTSPTAPFSGGVLAQPGYTIVHATLHTPLPYERGFAFIARHLEAQGRPRAALCAVELRCTRPYTREGFNEFNRGYRALLESWGIFVQGYSPAARTNVAPAAQAPSEPVLYACSYTVPNPGAPATFVVSGAAETPGVRDGETSLDAMREKTASALGSMQSRLTEFGLGWADVTALDVYTVQPLQPLLERDLLGPIGPAARHGLHWFYSRPPVLGPEIEIDVRATPQELRLYP